MVESKKTIIEGIKNFIAVNGGTFSAWYVDISKDAERRLFMAHKVNRTSGLWIYRSAASSEIAREVEKYFVMTLGTDGGAGGGTQTADMIYAYKKTSMTAP